MNRRFGVRLLSVFVMSLGVVAALGQDTRTVSEPVIPAVMCSTLQANITADSTPSGGLTLAQETSFDTARIQTALTSCQKGQAVELQPSGSFNAFLIQPITIPAGVTLLVDAGVTVLASRNPADYQKGTSTNCGTVGGAGSGCQPLISITNAPGAAIMGYGAIDGRGAATMLVGGADSGQTWWDLANGATAGNEIVPILLNVSGSVNVTLYRITFQNSTHFHITASSADNMILWGTKIITPWDTHNTDGFDPGGFNNTTVQDAYFSDGDDEIALTGGSSPLTQNMTVNNAHFFSGHGMSIGSHTTYGISNLLVNGLNINDDPANGNSTGLRIKSDATGGGLVQNVTYQNVCMQNVASPIVMTAYYTTDPGTSIPQFRNINFHNVHALTPGKISFNGYDNATTNGITDLLGMNFNNVSVDGISSGQVTAQYAQLTLGPDPVNFASYLAGVGVTVTNNVSNANAAYNCPAGNFNILAGEIVHGPSTVAAGQNVTLQAQILTPKETSYATYLAARGSNPGAMLRLPVPTGTVSLLEGSNVLGTATLVASAALGNANLVSVNVGTLAPGLHTITGSYSGDANYGAQSFGKYSLLVSAGAASTTVLSADATALIPGQSVTFTAQVSSATAGTPSGTVTFYDASYPLTTAAVGANGAATFTTTSLGNIAHTITAVYSGDAVYGSSNSNALAVTVTQAKSNVTFTANVTTATQGQPVTFTATVTPSNGSSTDVPTGNMAFKDNGKTPSNMTLVNGTVSYTTTAMVVGAHTTFGSYGGDTNFASAVSANLTVTIVAGATTTTTLGTNVATIFPGQSVLLTAGVSSATAGTLTGTFTFYDGTNVLGTVPVSGGGATLNIPISGVGTHSITAVYNGDMVYAPSTSAVTTVVAALAPTTLVLTTDATSGRGTPGQSVTFTAVLNVATGGSPTGAVTFYDGSAVLGTVVPVAGTAMFATTGLPVGAHTVLASYGGDVSFGGSQSNSIYVVVSSSATGVPVAPVLLPQVISTFAGNGTNGVTGDGGLATAATVSTDLRGLAVDGFGTVFIGDPADARVRSVNALSGVIKTFQGAGTVCSGHTDSNGDGCIALQTQGAKARGLATDKNGNLYIAGYTDNLVHRVDTVTNVMTLVAGQVASVSSTGTAGTATDGTVATAAPLNGPRGVWVDNLGNVFIADVGNRQVRMVYNAGTFAGLSTSTLVKGAIYLVVGNAGSTNVDKGLATATGTSGPQGVYVDNQQNIFIPDSSRLRVVYEGGSAVANLIAATNSGTTATPGYIYTVAGGGSTAYTAGTTVLGTSIALSSVAKIAADANGNLYLGDSGKNVVWFYDVQTGYIRSIAGGATTVCAGATDALGDGCPGIGATLNAGTSAQAVAVDAAGNLYVTDPGNARVRKVSSNLNFAATGTGASLTQALNVHFGVGDAGVSYVLPVASGDFAVSGAPVCVTNADTTSDCTVQVAFSPVKPGLRTMPLVVTASSGAVATFVLSGTGTGPVLAVDPGTTAALGAGITAQGVAADAAGNVYVADKASGTLLKFAAGGATSVGVLSGLSQPYQVAVDGAGSVYVADSGNNRVMKLGVGGVVSTVGTGLNAPRGVAVDSMGDVYIADTGNSRVVEVPAAPGSQVVVGSGLSSPTNLAVDAANNLYVLDYGNARVVEIAPGTTAMPVLSLESISPVALAVDAAADVYVADAAGQQVLMYAAGASAGSVVASGVAMPVSVAVDGGGNLYVADGAVSSVKVVNRAMGAAVFASSAAPITAALTNVGNGVLTFTAPGISQTDMTDFSVGAAAANGCALAGGTLAAGASCGVTGIYSPLNSGTQTDVVSFLSNGGAASLTLTGTGVASTATTTAISAPSPATPTFGQSVSFTATVSGGRTAPDGAVTFTVDATSLAPIALVNGQATGSFSNLSAGSHTVTVLYAPVSGFAASSAGPVSFTVGKVTPSLTWSPATTLAYGTGLGMVENASAVGLPGMFTYTATAAGSAPIAISSTSYLPVGSYSLGVIFTPTDAVDYASASATVTNFTVTKASTVAGVGPTQNVVAADGSGNYPTLSAAIATLPTTGGAIYVRPGSYSGQNLIATSNVQLRGLGGDPTKVVLTGSNSAGTKGSDQASATLGVTGNNFYMENIYVANTFQADNPAVTFNTQSIALWLTGDKDVVYNSQMVGQQDTLYADKGPSRQYFNMCKVVGNVDYIFGDSAAVFDNCIIYTVYHGSASGGTTITAQKKSVATGSAGDYLSGYVIINSQLTAETDLGAPTNLAYGRPWGMYSTNVFINDSVQTVIPAGWVEFTPGTTNYLPTSTYAEYGNYGPGYSVSGREQYATQLTVAQAAAYAPDTFLGGTDSWSPTAGLKTYIAGVVPAVTSLAIVPGSSVTMVARVAAPALGTPTGTLTFYDGTNVLSAVTLDALGEASYTTSALTNGAHAITVQYSGDGNFVGSSSSAVAVTAGSGSATTLQLQGSSLTYGQGTTATATVSAGIGVGVPMGTVTFSVDGVASTPVALTAGQAALTIPGTTAVGSHAVSAVYNGDGMFVSSTGAAMNFSVAKAVLTVTGSSALMTYGGTVPTVTAAITGFVNAEPVSVVSGSAAVTTTATSTSVVGSYPVVAVVGTLGAANYSFAFVNGAITVGKAGSATGLSVSATSVATGASVTLTAVVSSTAGVPTGVVTFLNGATSLGTGTLTGQGVATLTTSALALGANSVTASYAGDENFAGSVSGATTITGVAPPSFSLSAAPATVTIASGAAGSSTITLTPVGGYSGTATLSCGTLPANVSCTFAPATLTAGGLNAAVSSVLTINTNGQVAEMKRPGVAPVLWATLLCLPMSLLLTKRRRWLPTLVVLAGAMAAMSVTGCGGSASSSGGNKASPGTSTVVVTAMGAGGVAQTVSLTVTIQ